MVENKIFQLIDILAESAAIEFYYAADFFWKAPSLLKEQTSIEISKLFEYFPTDVTSRVKRWQHESHKLERIFPFLMATGNLYTITSLFEVYVFRLAQIVENDCNKSLEAIRGQGLQRYFLYLHSIGVETKKLTLWPQVDAAIKVRNCLMHASGMLSSSRDEKELRRITASGTFLTPEHRRKKRRPLDEVRIIRDDFGDRLHVANDYAWLLSAYFRDYFLELCEATKILLGKPSSMGD
jgi:hypothetical protein